MTTQSPTGNTAPVLSEILPPADTAAESCPIRIAPDTQPTAFAPATPKRCKHCGLIGPHVEPTESTTCRVCGHAHGSTRLARDRRTNTMANLRVHINHSLDGVVREDGQTGAWKADPICTLCQADLTCQAFEADRAAKADKTGKTQRPIWPRFWALSFALEEAARRNRIDAAEVERNARREAQREARQAQDAAILEARTRFDEIVGKRGRGFERSVLRRFKRNRAAGLNAAIDAELSDLAPLDALVEKHGIWVRPIVFAHVTATRCSIPTAVATVTPGIEAEVARKARVDALVSLGYHRTDARGNGRRPEPRREAIAPSPEAPREPKAGERGGPRREKGDRRHGTDKHGNPNLNGRGYVTPDDL